VTDISHFPPSVKPMELWAFLENSDFQRYTKTGELYRQDEVRLIRHDEFLQADYQLLLDIGCKGVRDAARWYITHPAPGCYDWAWLDQVVAAADAAGLTLYLDLWHYGYPDWLDLMSPDAIDHFADFARQIALRYPTLRYYCISNEPSLMVEFAGRQGRWRPFLKGRQNAQALREQICKMIIAASRAVLAVRPDAILALPEPWHATYGRSESKQSEILDSIMGRRHPEWGGSSELVTIVGLNHYRDSTLPPFHRMIMKARDHWPDKPLWLTETSGPPRGWKQTEWFWWMMAEVRLAQMHGVDIPVFTWAPTISMYDWVDETKHLPNGIWVLRRDGRRAPNGLMLKAIAMARSFGYLV
jgi:hypothetical protein